MRIERFNPAPWSRVNEAYRVGRQESDNRINDRNGEKNDKVIVSKVAHEEESQRPRESESYNREGERTSYIPPGKVFEAQG